MSTTFELCRDYEEVTRRLLAAGASVAAYGTPPPTGAQISILVSSSGDADLVECVIADLVTEGYLQEARFG